MAGNGGRTLGRENSGGPIMTVTTSSNAERLLTPGEVAALFRVDPKTVTRWASAGRIGSIRTPGGHRRFRESEVREMLADLTSEATVQRVH
jgi:excisionase family DNA binding protein